MLILVLYYLVRSTGTIYVYFERICIKSRVSSRYVNSTKPTALSWTCHHDRPPEEEQHTQLSLTDDCGSLAKMYNECGGRQSRSSTRVAVAPHKTSNNIS